jgi:hypothetical protein
MLEGATQAEEWDELLKTKQTALKKKQRDFVEIGDGKKTWAMHIFGRSSLKVVAQLTVEIEAEQRQINALSKILSIGQSRLVQAELPQFQKKVYASLQTACRVLGGEVGQAFSSGMDLGLQFEDSVGEAEVMTDKADDDAAELGQ